MERGDTVDTWLDLPPTPRQMRCALAVAAVALAGFAAVVPIADTPLTQLNAFFPSLDATDVRRQTRLDPRPLLIAQPKQIPAHGPDPLPKTNQDRIVRAEN